MGDVTAAEDSDVNVVRSIYFTTFDDVQLEVRSQSVTARWTNGVGVVRVECDPESELPRVHVEQLEGSDNRRATSEKIARLLYGLDGFDCLSQSEYSDHLYALGKLMQAVFANNAITGGGSMESLISRLSSEESTEIVNVANDDDGLTERKEQLLKRINTLLSGYVSKQLRDMFPNTGDIVAEVSVEFTGEHKESLTDPSNWAALARHGTTSHPACAMLDPPEMEVTPAFTTVASEMSAHRTDAGRDQTRTQDTPLDRGTTSKNIQGSQDIDLGDEIIYSDNEDQQGETLRKQQLKQRLLLLQKQQQQQQQHTGTKKDSSSVSDRDSAGASSLSRHSPAGSESSPTETNVSGQKTSRQSSADDEL